MDHIFTISKKPSKTVSAYKQNIFNKLEKSILCSFSSTNVIAFSTESNIEECNSLIWSSNVYVADLNSPWQVHKILCNSSPVTVLQWDYTGELLLIADESGCIRIYRTKDYILNDWVLLLQTTLQGEHIIASAFFHSGKRICLNSDKKDSSSYTEKFQHVKFACSVKKFGGRPASGALLLTTTGMLAAILLPQHTTQRPMLIATESLAPTRIYVKTADICYGKNGHFLLAVSSGDPSMPIQCYKVSVKKTEEKCIITSQSLLSFFLFEAPKETLMDQLAKEKNCVVSHVKWIMREDADSLVVAASSEKMSCLQVWELREKALPVHKSLGNSETPQFFNTVLWQYQCHFQYNSQVTSLATSKLSLLNSISSGYVVVTFADNSVHCLYRDTLKSIVSTTLSVIPRYLDEPNAKYQKVNTKISNIDMSWLGNVLLIVDSDDSLHLFKLPPQIDSSTPLSVPYCTTILEYCMMSGLDWLDLLLVLRPGMLDALCDRLTESFNRQPVAVQQYFYVQHLCIKISLYRLSFQGQSKANDLTHFLMLHSISTAFKSLLRPSEMNSHEKSPAVSLATVIAEGQCDVDKALMHLEAKEFTVETTTLQSLQQLIQWVADLALNLLVKLPDSRPATGKPYELLRDIKALNILREMLVLIRIWGLLRPACLPVFIKSDASLDVLALVFRLLSRLVQNVNEPDESLIGKGRRLIVTHIGSEDGFVPNGALVFESKKTGDYHEDMDANRFEAWFKAILPYLEPGSVVVMDNAPYHSRRLETFPTTAWKKGAIIDWLERKHISFNDSMLKVELLNIARQHKPKMIKYAVEEIACEHGILIQRLPPYHCELNPIELIWAQVKTYVAKNNTTFKLNEVKPLLQNAIDIVSPDSWKNCIRHVITEEDRMWDLDTTIDIMVDVAPLVISINDDSDSDSSEDFSDSSSDPE